MQAFLHRLTACLFLFLFAQPVFAATTLLPNGKQCFTTATGAVVSGSVNMFYPNTTTPKATWQDANQVTQNSQPIQLDANGCAVIYGVGVYRQQLYDGPVVAGVTTGNLIWDQPTTDTSAFNSVFWAGLSSGTANAITVVDTGFNATDGSVIQFVALNTNTGATTLNPSSYGAISIVKDTTGGPVALVGGEIITGNIINVVYYANTNTFHLVNTVIASASGATAPMCGASGLVIANGATGNSQIAITADQVLLQTTGGLVINRSNISVTVNITTGTITSTANGMDGETLSAAAQWIYVWLIDNGSATAGLTSVAIGNGLTPNMPSGYTYKCRVGAMRVDASSNLLRTRQNGNRATYVPTLTTNTLAYPTIDSGAKGTWSATSVPMTAWATDSATSVVPPTAGGVDVLLVNEFNNIGNANLGASGSSANGGPRSTSPSECSLVPAVMAISMPCYLQFSSSTQQVFYASDGASGALLATGWRDRGNLN